ncbi:hypothetical protein EDB19DRAFT_109313 [Suillus lakei]|nr:hypothetical protein EDB19DRAFT_109313 [Suillus lakei]
MSHQWISLLQKFGTNVRSNTFLSLVSMAIFQTLSRASSRYCFFFRFRFNAAIREVLARLCPMRISLTLSGLFIWTTPNFLLPSCFLAGGSHHGSYKYTCPQQPGFHRRDSVSCPAITEEKPKHTPVGSRVLGFRDCPDSWALYAEDDYRDL